MPPEKYTPKEFLPAPTFTIDISQGETPQDQVNTFLREIRKLGFYKPKLLFSGFDGKMANKNLTSMTSPGFVYCSTERAIKHEQNDATAFEFAMNYNEPAIAVYNSEKMESTDIDFQFKIKESSALVAIIFLQK